uniref:Uncharacterized protein n=1 Tax=Cacopsylla melanoneura TaxID=428564 RepID=A0A8D8XB33_9HEMI
MKWDVGEGGRGEGSRRRKRRRRGRGRGKNKNEIQFSIPSFFSSHPGRIYFLWRIQKEYSKDRGFILFTHMSRFYLTREFKSLPIGPFVKNVYSSAYLRIK